MAAADEVRAERVRLEKRALTRRSMLASSLGFVVGIGGGVGVADLLARGVRAGEPVEPDPLPVPVEAIDDDLRWALELSASGTAGEIERSFEVYWTEVFDHQDDFPQLFLGMERIGDALLDGRLDVPRGRMRRISLLVAGLLRNKGGTGLSRRQAQLERRLRAAFR